MRTSHVVAAGVFSALAFCAPETVWADQVLGTRFDATETQHDIEVRVGRGHAVLVAERTVVNGGTRSDQAVFFLDLPSSAAATRLRSAKTETDGSRTWFEAVLMPAAEAEQKYKELTGLGAYRPMDPALLHWRSQGELILQVFPVGPGSAKTVEYTMEMPSRYEHGRFHLELPPIGTESRPASLRFAAINPADRVTVNGIPVSPTARVVANRQLEIELAPAGVSKVSGGYASVPLGTDRVLVRANVNMAPKLGVIPQHAALAVVLDTSKSMADELPIARAAARAWLGHFPSAQVELITFGRKARRPWGRALPVAEASAKLAAFEPEAENGSHLDAAMVMADSVLVSAPTDARRIVVFTDLLAREALSPERFASASLQSKAIVHIANVTSGYPTVKRDDDSPWNALPRKTGGLLWEATCGPLPDASARIAFEELARPMRLDKAEVKGLPDSVSVPDTLDEGTGIDHFGIETQGAGKLEVAGELWSKPFTATIGLSAEEARRAAAFAFGTELHQELSDAEQLALAMKGKAVSPFTSYLAIEPGVRPSTEGLDRTEQGGLGLSGIGEGGGGRGEGITLGFIGTSSFDRHQHLLNEMIAAWGRCQGGRGQADIVIETTLAEVVDVPSITMPAGTPVRLGECLREEAWKLDLSSAFKDTQRTWELHLEVP